MDQPRYNYRRRLPHLQKEARPLFVTFVARGRWILPEHAREEVLQCCLRQHGRMFDLHAAVVMPDHVHLIFTPLLREDGWAFSIPEIMRVLKSTATQAVNSALKRSGPLWQVESFDHVLRSNESLAEKIEYVMQNPVRGGLANSPEQYAWFWRNPAGVIDL